MKLAYEMAKAYKDNPNRNEAVEQVKHNNPDADRDILWEMWEAIDAYTDLYDS